MERQQHSSKQERSASSSTQLLLPYTLHPLIGRQSSKILHGSVGLWGPVGSSALPSGDTAQVAAASSRPRPSVCLLVLRAINFPPLLPDDDGWRDMVTALSLVSSHDRRPSAPPTPLGLPDVRFRAGCCGAAAFFRRILYCSLQWPRLAASACACPASQLLKRAIHLQYFFCEKARGLKIPSHRS